MSEHHLATYLNDHLAGAVVALELLEHLEKAHAGDSVGSFAVALRDDILADRNELEALMGRLHITVSRTRQAMTWLGEKMTALKLRLDDSAGGPLRWLEVLDTVSTGIEGKRLLWLALSAAAVSGLTAADYDRLVRRAEEQRHRVEMLRRDAAKSAFAAAPSAGNA